MRILRGVFVLVFGWTLVSMEALAQPDPPPNAYCGNPINPSAPPNAPMCPSTPPEPGKEGCDTCKGSPCYAASGAYTRTETDLVVPTVGNSITIARAAVTSRLSAGLSGIGVASSLVTRIYYGTYLFAAPSTYRRIADVLMPSGAFFRFLQNADGTFTAVAPRKDGLVKNGDGTWDLTIQGSRTRYRFLSSGNLSYLEDEYGNRLEYTYDGNGRLIRIAGGAGSGRYVDVYYAGSGRIGGVQDSSGHQVT